MASACTVQNTAFLPSRFASLIFGIFNSYVRFVCQHPFFFLMPYLLIYIVACHTGIEVPRLVRIYQALNAIHLAVFISRLPFFIRSYVFWIAVLLFGLFSYTGCFFEYPSDTWSHYGRTVVWGSLSHISNAEQEVQRKFYYLWEWSILSLVTLLNRRFVLDLLGAFSQVVLLIEVFRFSSKLALNRFWSGFLVFLFVSTYGYSLFGIRYYGISTTNIAYAGYLFLLGECLSGSKFQLRDLGGWGITLLLLFLNHKPEFGFSLIAASVSLLVRLAGRPWTRSQLNLGVLSVAAISILASHALRPVSTPLSLVSFFSKHGLDAHFHAGALSVFAPLAAMASFRTLHPLLFCLTLLPFFSGSCVWAENIALRLVSSPIDVLRIYWIIPSSVVWCHFFSQLDAPLSRPLKTGVRSLIFLALLFIGFQPIRPWAGKLWFQFHSGNRRRELLETDTLAVWIARNRNFNLSKNYLSDDSTLFALNAHLGFVKPHDRINPLRLTLKFHTREAIATWIKDYSATFVLLPFTALLQPAGPSQVGEILHWPVMEGDLLAQIDPALEANAHQLLDELGWSRTFVPPYYLLREPPVESKPP